MTVRDYEYHVQKRLYGPKDVRECFPWIPVRTLHNRIKAGLTPVEKSAQGRGRPVQMTYAQLVNCGVVDEMAAAGCWNENVDLVYSFYYEHPEHSEDPKETHPVIMNKGFPRMFSEWPEKVLEYWLKWDFQVGMRVNIGHFLETSDVAGPLAPTRLWITIMHPVKPGTTQPLYELETWNDFWRGKDIYTMCYVSVDAIRNNVDDTLGIADLRKQVFF